MENALLSVPGKPPARHARDRDYAKMQRPKADRLCMNTWNGVADVHGFKCGEARQQLS
jgi:hypothetical protein